MNEMNKAKILTFMKIEIGKTMNVVELLRKIPEIVEIDYITGEYDLMIRLEANSPKKIHHIFLEEIDKIPWILSSSSNLLLKKWQKK